MTDRKPQRACGEKMLFRKAPEDFFLLEGLTEEEKAACWQAEAITVCRCVRGEVLYDRTRARRSLVLLLEGRARVLQGRVVMNELSPGQVFGAAALFGEAEPYESSVVAAADGRLAFIPQETVSAWMRQYPRIAENYIRFLSGRIRFLNRRLATLTAGPADDRLWRYLLSRRSPDGTVTLPGGMTALAEALGVGRSSLYRSLETLIADGRVERRDKHVLRICGRNSEQEEKKT